MHVLTVGLSHKTAPVELREKLSISSEQQEEVLTKILKISSVKEVVVVSTCNRTEFYCLALDSEKASDDIIRFISSYYKADFDKIREAIYIIHAKEAIRHLFHVASSLDSMIVGEAQILGQVKEAYKCALELGATESIFNRLFREAITIGKRVRTETEIGENAVSISYAAVELAKKIFGNLTGKTAMIIGAGKMSEITAKHLVSSGIKKILIANRTYERSVELSKNINGTAIPFEDLNESIADADVILSSTGAPNIIITKKSMVEAMKKRKNKPVFLIDIAVPRDIDPEINDLYNAYLYDIDDLHGIVDSNIEARGIEADKAQVIIEDHVEDFVKWMSTLEVVPTITALRNKADEICKNEVEKALSRLDSSDEKSQEVVNSMARAIANKLLHEPIVRIKQLAGNGESYTYVESLQELFNLDPMNMSQNIKSERKPQ